MIASAGCVVQNMHLAATDLGLGSVYLGSIQAVSNSFEVLYKLKLQDGFWPVAALAVGNAKEAAEEREIPVDKIYTNIIA
jgi:nitroreductase